MPVFGLEVISVLAIGRNDNGGTIGGKMSGVSTSALQRSLHTGALR